MPRAKYTEIYKDLKMKIESEEYEFQELLPSENTLVQEYDCSRNTIRRAISDLVTDGYVQTMQGKGVRVIFQPVLQTSFTIGCIETFTESAKRNHHYFILIFIFAFLFVPSVDIAVIVTVRPFPAL